MLNCIENVLGVLTWIAPLALNPLSLFTLCMAIYFHIYYWYEKQVGDYRTDSLTLVRHLSKEPYQGTVNDSLSITLMLKSNISPNACTMLPYKTSFFLFACFGGSLKMIDFMLLRGADPHQTNEHGDGAFYFAVYGIVCRLKNSSRKISRSIMIQQSVLLIDTLTNLGCNINLQNNSGFTPLHWALISKEQWLVSHLVSRGAVDDDYKRELTNAKLKMGC